MTEKAIVAKKFLSRIYWADMHINAKMRQVQRLRCAVERITQQFGGVSVTHTRNTHSMEDSIVKLVDYEKSIDAEIDNLLETRKAVKEVIDEVSDCTERVILELRYESCCTWPEIESLANMGHSQLFARHTQGLEKVYEILKQKGLVDSID